MAAVGRLNGGGVSHKVNREVVLLMDAPAVYERLAEVFQWDWMHLPGVLKMSHDWYRSNGRPMARWLAALPDEVAHTDPG